MRDIASACVLAVIIFELHQGVTGSKPKIIPAPSWSVIAKDEFLIQEGDELKIVCQGEGRIQFSKQNLPPYFEQSDSTGSFDESTGTYTFIRPRTVAEDTGWYACADESIEIRNDLQTIDHPSDNISWIYVYVNSSAPLTGMGTNYEAIVLVAGSDGVVPCRPTSPDLPVMLELNGDEFPLPEDTKYDPKIGFILKAVGREHNGETFTCKINGTYAEDTLWPIYYALVEVVPRMEAPTINQDTLRHVVWGENITLECTIIIEPTRFNLRWIAPSSVPKQRLISPAKMIYVDSISPMEIWKTELIVKNVEQSDGGEYICVAETITGHKTQSSMKLKIWDPSHTHIDLIVEGQKDILIPEHDTAQWKIVIDTYPVQFEWKWYKENGALIETTEVNSRSKYSHRQNGLYHLFRISHLTTKDSGEYTLSVSTSKNVTNITLPLTVFNLAESFTIRDPGIITVGDNISVTCDASVYDYVDMITWKNTSYGDLEFNSERIRITQQKTKFNWQSILHIRNVSQSDAGKYTCEALDNWGHSEKETYLLRVEAARVPEFDYTNMNNSKISIDLKKERNRSLILDCRADGRPIPKIIWSKNNELLNESTQYRFLQNNTRLHIVYFFDAETDSGIYECKAENRIGTVQRYMEIIIIGKSDSTTFWIILLCFIITMTIIAIVYIFLKRYRYTIFYKSLDRSFGFTRYARSGE